MIRLGNALSSPGRLADRVAVREFDQDTSLRLRYRTI